MKIKLGFVTNSSSTAYLLDMRDERTRKEVERILSIKWTNDIYVNDDWWLVDVDPRTDYDIFSRSSFVITGNTVKEYLEEMEQEKRKDQYYDGLSSEFSRKAEEADWNVAFIMDSDEGMGGYIPFNEREIKILHEEEYH